MKYFLLFTLVSVSALAQNMQIYRHDAVEERVPLIRKINNSGYTTALGRRFSDCNVYVNKVVVTREVGLVKIKEYKDIFIDKNIVRIAQDAMEEETKRTENRLCDGPSTSIEVLGESEKGMIYSTGGCGRDKVEKSGENSQIILDIVNQYCPKTY